MSWERVKLGAFLKAREDRFKPNDKAIKGLRRVDKIDFTGKLHISDTPSKTDMILIKKGDLLISGINVAKGAVIVYEGEADVTATIHYSSYEFDKKRIDVEFLKLFLKSPEFLDAIKEQVPGGIKTEIKPKHFLPLEVLMPTDVEEQKEVVKSFSIVKSKNSVLSSELSRQFDLVKQLRQAFLREAMQGKLVPQDSNDEPANELLKKIKAKRVQLIKEKKVKKEKELPPIKPEEIPFEIPDDWLWCKIGDISYSIVPNRDKPQSFNGDIKWITQSNFSESSYKLNYKLNNIGLTNLEVKKYNCRVMPSGGVIMSCVGRFDLVCLIEKEIVANQQLHCFVPFGSINPMYLCYSIKVFSRLIEKTAIKTTIKYINKTKCESILVPLPPLLEQHRIVSKLEQLMRYCDELEQSITQSQAQNEQLLQQVLREALQHKKEYKQKDELSLAAES